MKCSTYQTNCRKFLYFQIHWLSCILYFISNIINVVGMQFLGLDDNKKIGMLLLTLTIICYSLGIMFLFRRSLILLANILFLLGLYFFIGISGIVKFFTKKGKVQGSGIYFVGLTLIIFELTFFGTITQLIGLFIIFRSFLPDFYDYMCRLPFVGSYLKSYKIQNALDRISGNPNNRI